MLNQLLALCLRGVNFEDLAVEVNEIIKLTKLIQRIVGFILVFGYEVLVSQFDWRFHLVGDVIKARAIVLII